MSEATMIRRDRTIGLALLVAGLLVSFVPDFQLGGQTIKTHYVGVPWILAVILLLSSDSAARPNPKLIRWGAAILFVGGLASPFLVNLINRSVGA